MFEFFDYLVTFLSSLVDFFVSSFTTIIEFFGVMVKSVAAVSLVMTALPPVFQTVAVVVVAYAVIVNIIHFGG